MAARPPLVLRIQLTIHPQRTAGPQIVLPSEMWLTIRSGSSDALGVSAGPVRDRR